VTGLTEKAVDPRAATQGPVEDARERWEESMLRQVEALRASIRQEPPERAAARAGAAYEGGGLRLTYWGKPVRVGWPQLETIWEETGAPCAVFDTAMLLYYLKSADGAPPADRWIGFRELPDGAFYSQAYQRYSGDRLARAFGDDPEGFHTAALSLEGERLTALGHAYAFQALPRLRLAAVLWPGDEEFPARGAILFDASASHYMTTDGLALLGGGLAGRLEKKLSAFSDQRSAHR
jgi:hypothetical protein